MRIKDLIEIKHGFVYLAGNTLGDNPGMVAENLHIRGIETDCDFSGFIYGKIKKMNKENSDELFPCHSDFIIEDEYFEEANFTFVFEDISADWLNSMSFDVYFTKKPYHTFADIEQIEDESFHGIPEDYGDEWPCKDFFSVSIKRDKTNFCLSIKVDQKYGAISTETEQQLWHALMEIIRRECE